MEELMVLIHLILVVEVEEDIMVEMVEIHAVVEEGHLLY